MNIISFGDFSFVRFRHLFIQNDTRSYCNFYITELLLQHTLPSQLTCLCPLFKPLPDCTNHQKCSEIPDEGTHFFFHPGQLSDCIKLHRDP